MKRYLVLGLSLLLSLPLGGCKFSADNSYHGYVEGEFVMIAPTSGGLLQSLNVERGQQVEKGASLFSLDLTELTAGRDAAQGALDQAKAQLEDLMKGDRPEDIDILIKQKAQAEATLANAEKEYKRVQPLAKSGASSQSALDDAKAGLDTAQARLEEIEARIKTANMGARIDRIEAAKAGVGVAQQGLIQAQKKLDEAAPKAPVSGLVDDTYYRPGEFVPAGRPVINLLPPGNVKVRFFVPQAIAPKLKMGQTVQIGCDGCAAPITAKISYIAPQAEYTPPIIYSVESRDKLVFMVEVKPDEPQSGLRPGLPVDITIKP